MAGLVMVGQRQAHHNEFLRKARGPRTNTHNTAMRRAAWRASTRRGRSDPSGKRSRCMPRSTTQLLPLSEVWEWQVLGRCRDVRETQFFHPDDDLGRISRRLREAAAKRLCHGCPVRAQCATHALAVGEEYGVWGGFSESDRV